MYYKIKLNLINMTYIVSVEFFYNFTCFTLWITMKYHQDVVIKYFLIKITLFFIYR